jgi:hypothetical protein
MTSSATEMRRTGLTSDEKVCSRVSARCSSSYRTFRGWRCVCVTCLLLQMERKFRYGLIPAIQAKLQEDSSTRGMFLRELQSAALNREHALKLSGVIADTCSGEKKNGNWKQQKDSGGSGGANASSAGGLPRQQQAAGPPFLHGNQPAAQMNAVQSGEQRTPLSPRTKAECQEKGLCYWCRKTGHTTQECPPAPQRRGGGSGNERSR